MRLPAPTALLAIALLPAAPAGAAESYDNCTGFIDTLPAVISTPGRWCLRKDLATAIASGGAIDVSANNVVIDCNGFKIGGLAAGPASMATGISAYSRTNISVRDCLIRGFARGVDLYYVSGGVVEDVVTEGSYFYGILFYGNNCTIRRNRVEDTGSANNSGTAAGIFGSCDILDNTVNNVEQADATGISVYYASGHTIEGNRVRGVAGVATSHGILANYSVGAVVRDNHVRGTGAIGIKCSGNEAIALGNVVSGFVLGVDTECQDSGNVVVP